MTAMWKRRYVWARNLAALEVILLSVGWLQAIYPYLLPPHITISHAAAPPSVLGPIVVVLVMALAIVIPAFAWLYRIFKREQLMPGG